LKAKSTELVGEALSVQQLQDKKKQQQEEEKNKQEQEKRRTRTRTRTRTSRTNSEMSNNEANNTGTTSLTLTSETTVEPLLDEIENESTIDTTVVSEVKDWTEKMRLLEPTFEGVGDKLLCLIDNLPKTNATMGQGMTKTRILKFLVSQKYLQSENKLANLSYGRLNGTKKLLFLEYIQTISRIKEGEDQNNCMQRFKFLLSFGKIKYFFLW
jgi:hypothetical protein